MIMIARIRYTTCKLTESLIIKNVFFYYFNVINIIKVNEPNYVNRMQLKILTNFIALLYTVKLE